MQTKLINAKVELGHRPRTWRIQSINGAVPVRCTFVMGFRGTTDGECIGTGAQRNRRSSKLETKGVQPEVRWAIRQRRTTACLLVGERKQLWSENSSAKTYARTRKLRAEHAPTKPTQNGYLAPNNVKSGQTALPSENPSESRKLSFTTHTHEPK